MGDGGGEVLSYYHLSMHRLKRYAPGPDGLDWATQLAPFRQYRGCRQVGPLHRPLEESPPYDGVFSGPAAAPSRPDRRSLSQMFYDGLALSAWKEAGGTRWVLRTNPSSGNLHPTEAYLPPPGGTLEPAPLLAHYRPDKYVLEMRGELPAPLTSLLDDCLPAGGCFLALTSVSWRKAWKYGERAYRYCQYDLGRALACLSIAAAIQGWKMRLLCGVAESALGGLSGLDRDGFAECENVDALFWIGSAFTQEPSLSPRLCEGLAALPLAGAPNRLSWEYRDRPELQRTHGLCRAPCLPARPWRVVPGGPGNDNPGLPLRPLLHRWRSVQRMDGRASIDAELPRAWLRRLLPERSLVPFAVTDKATRIDLPLFVHRVRGLVPRLYWLDRSDLRRPPMCEDFLWQRVDPELPLYLLQEGDARTLSAYLPRQQDIAGDGCVALAMLAHLGVALEEGSWCYPRLHRECEQLDQLLYLGAETTGLSGTGTGCYYDPLVHESLGPTDESMASLYHSTLGRAVWDTRLCNMPAYPTLRRDQPVDSPNSRKHPMTQILDNLVALLSLKPIEENLFQGMSQDLSSCQLYDGQVPGQALSAASQTVKDDHHAHSMYGYFLRLGDASMPVVYQVDRVRDGGSFSTRRVTVIQKDQPIFILSSPFQYDEEGLYHQIEMPEVVGPDSLPSELKLARQRAERVPERIHDKLLYPKPIEVRPVTQHDPYDPQPDEPVKYLWFRVDGKLPDIPALHKYLLVYASDFGFPTALMQPHAASV